LIGEEPSFEDYLATGALANVPLWVYLLLLTFDSGSFSQSNPILFFTLVPVAVMIAGGMLASYLLCRRRGRRFMRIGLLVGVTATIVNFVFNFVSSAPAALPVSAVCFVTSGVFGAVMWEKQHKG